MSVAITTAATVYTEFTDALRGHCRYDTHIAAINLNS